MIKIAHLTHLGPRANIIINQGLMQLNMEFDLDRTYYSKGKSIKIRNKDILKNIKSYDIIFAGNLIYLDLLDNLWNRVIWYDYEDDCNVLPIQPKLYFKRSVVNEERKFVNIKNAIHIDYCAMEEYYLDEQKKDIDIACFLTRDGVRRTNVLNQLELIGVKSKSTSFGSNARNSLNKSNHPAYEDYLKMLSKSKVVFTAFPQKHDGDSRTWEAFASRSLVVRDMTYINSENPLKDNVHFLNYDASNVESIKQIIEKVNSMKDKEIKEMGICGFEHVKKYHMAKNRVKYMLNHF